MRLSSIFAELLGAIFMLSPAPLLTAQASSPQIVFTSTRSDEVHYHQERNHQGKDNLLLFPMPTRTPGSRKHGKLRCQQTVGRSAEVLRV